MINSHASDSVFQEARQAAGPEPEGVKVTPGERVHLLIMVADHLDAMSGGDTAAEQRAAQALESALAGRGLRPHHIADTYRDHLSSPVGLANALAAHPAMKVARVRVGGPCEWTHGDHAVCEGGTGFGRADAVHLVNGRRVCGFHSPYDTTVDNLELYGYERVQRSGGSR